MRCGLEAYKSKRPVYSRVVSKKAKNQELQKTAVFFFRMHWRSLGVPACELRLAHTLPTGQAFGWRPVSVSEWEGAIGDAAVALREAPETFEAEWRCASNREAEVLERLRDYFQLSTPLKPLYEQWIAADREGRLPMVAEALPGVRVLRQDPGECLMSFICSSNNNIGRITLMLNRLKMELPEILELPGSAEPVYAFPSLEKIATLPEERLRDLGFGYRAPYVVETAKAVVDNDINLLDLRREKSRSDVKALLCKNFKGVGPKVADCVALFSLDFTDAVPVDTHVWRLARRDYDATGTLKNLQASGLTPKICDEVGDSFRTTFGSHAGWAHSLLFAAELPAFADKLPPSLRESMQDFRDNEKRENKDAKLRKKQIQDEKHLTKLSLNQDELLEELSSLSGEDETEPSSQQPTNKTTPLLKRSRTKTTTTPATTTDHHHTGGSSRPVAIVGVSTTTTSSRPSSSRRKTKKDYSS